MPAQMALQARRLSGTMKVQQRARDNMSAGLMSLENLVSFLAAHEVEKIYVKELAANDNSKNQVYFGPGFKALTLFPMGEITPDPNAGNPIFKASVDYLWIGDDLSLVTSPSAQIILYPQ